MMKLARFAAAVLNDFSQAGSLVYSEPMLCLFTLFGTPAQTIRAVTERALEHAASLGFAAVELEVDADDDVLAQVLTDCGGVMREPAVIEAWLDIDERPDVSDLADGYELRSRNEMDGEHHMAHETGAAFEQRLQQGSLYRSDLDLLVIDASGEHAAHALFWFDPTTSIAVVEPVRTLDGASAARPLPSPAHRRSRTRGRAGRRSRVDRLRTGQPRIRPPLQEHRLDTNHSHQPLGSPHNLSQASEARKQAENDRV